MSFGTAVGPAFILSLRLLLRLILTVEQALVVEEVLAQPIGLQTTWHKKKTRLCRA